MEQRRNARTGKVEDPQENPLTDGIVRHDSPVRKSGSEQKYEGSSPFYVDRWVTRRVLFKGPMYLRVQGPGAIRATLTRTPSASSLLRAGRAFEHPASAGVVLRKDIPSAELVLDVSLGRLEILTMSYIPQHPLPHEDYAPYSRYMGFISQTAPPNPPFQTNIPVAPLQDSRGATQLIDPSTPLPLLNHHTAALPSPIFLRPLATPRRPIQSWTIERRKGVVGGAEGWIGRHKTLPINPRKWPGPLKLSSPIRPLSLQTRQTALCRKGTEHTLQMRYTAYSSSAHVPNIDLPQINTTVKVTWSTMLGAPLVDDRPIMNAVRYRIVSDVAWTNRTMVSSNTDTNRTDVLAVVDTEKKFNVRAKEIGCAQPARSVYLIFSL
ncbi:hypothetical protein PR048_032519 [Dryococelus australis]|uniref:Uncharacterized protein n=1 Tax=Dryococelus australis TaxID=614101 RepID=A0ABQ9G384_9NEOP|nr:hypothetical protein PR048_032519 [Dryococelus australis]